MSFMKQLYDTYVKSGGDPAGFDAIERFIKDTMPAGGRPEGGYLYEGNSPFSLISGDPISSVVSGGSPLVQWLPSRFINYRFENVDHLEWISPEGFDGSQTYAEWLAGLSIPECGYGPATDWSGFSFQMSGGSFSWSTKMMKPYHDGGTTYYEKQPIYAIRGSSIGQPLSSDREWAIARLFFAAQTHMSYVLPYGDRQNSDMEWDGLLKILTPGYVQNRRIGPGVPHWADPLLVNGVALANASDILQTIRRVVRRLRNRIRARQWSLNFGDMAVVMNTTMWDNLAEAIAAGALYSYTNTYGFDGQISYKDFVDMIQATKQGGLGFGTIEIDGAPIPVLVDDGMGRNVTMDMGGTPTAGVLSDIMVLTRRVNGITLLEQQYVDWSKLDYPTNGMEDIVSMPQGHVRTGWITESNKCFYYYMEMAGRIVTYMQPFQAVIQNVSLATLDTDENESGAFYSPDFYAFGQGNRGGVGNTLLTPIG